MTYPLPVGPGTPYIVPPLLTSYPTGVDFSTIPMGRLVTTAQKTAALFNICQVATQQAEEYTNQPLRANAAQETFHGPGDGRVNMQRATQTCRVLLQRFPVMQITSVQVAPNAVWPRQYTVIPAGNFEPEYPPITSYGTNAPSAGGQGGQAVIIAPGWINWSQGRWGYVIQVSYISGWPHTSLTLAAAPATPPAAQTILTDNCAGWGPFTTGAPGATGIIYDGGLQEVIQCTAASAAAGPGILTLAAPLQYAHPAGTMVSALPETIVWAAALMASAEALTRGATATVVAETPGRAAGTVKPGDLVAQAEALLHPFRRSI